MNTKICTSIEQSKKLLSLGLDPSTADMYWACRYDCIRNKSIEWPVVRKRLSDGDYLPLLSQDIPCWSLDALLELVPKSIRNYDNRTWKNYGLNLFRSHYYCCGYSFGPSLSEENHDSLCCICSEESWLDAVYKTVIWCIEQGHIKVNK